MACISQDVCHFLFSLWQHSVALTPLLPYTIYFTARCFTPSFKALMDTRIVVTLSLLVSIPAMHAGPEDPTLGPPKKVAPGLKPPILDPMGFEGVVVKQRDDRTKQEYEDERAAEDDCHLPPLQASSSHTSLSSSPPMPSSILSPTGSLSSLHGSSSHLSPKGPPPGEKLPPLPGQQGGSSSPTGGAGVKVLLTLNRGGGLVTTNLNG